MIELRNVAFGYGGGLPVLAGATLVVPAGLTLLVGPNGCGKSTLLRLAAGVEHPDCGTVLVEGRDLWKEEAAARRGLAYIPEQPDITPFASVREVIKLVCRLRGEPLVEVDRILASVGLETFGRRSTRALSMGQRRRVLLAAAMLGRTRVLLLDEPLEAMDRAMRETIVAWVLKRCQDGAAAIVATHEFEGFEEAAARALTVGDGAVHLKDPLPAEPSDRRSILEHLARGADPAHSVHSANPANPGS